MEGSGLKVDKIRERGRGGEGVAERKAETEVRVEVEVERDVIKGNESEIKGVEVNAANIRRAARRVSLGIGTSAHHL